MQSAAAAVPAASAAATAAAVGEIKRWYVGTHLLHAWACCALLLCCCACCRLPACVCCAVPHRPVLSCARPWLPALTHYVCVPRYDADTTFGRGLAMMVSAAYHNSSADWSVR